MLEIFNNRNRPFNWECPHCGQHNTVTENISVSDHDVMIENVLGEIRLKTTIIICANPECNEPTIYANLHNLAFMKINGNKHPSERDEIQKWQLRPLVVVKQFPEYVPVPIFNDYKEAVLIKDLSPKASATLSRRCIQGILRDFWKVKPGRLTDEIKSVEDKIDPTTLAAIDAIRTVGNIGAHMEKDINIIIDVDPNEAELLIQLIEVLVDDWYVDRFHRQQRLSKITNMAAEKRSKK